MVIKYDTVENAFNQLTSEYNIEQVYTNREYETYSKERDQRVKLLL